MASQLILERCVVRNAMLNEMAGRAGPDIDIRLVKDFG